MKLNKKLLQSTVALILSAMLTFSCGRHDRYIVIQGYAQGGTYNVKLNMNGTEGMIRMRPEAIKTAIDSILNDIDTTLSGYNKGSVLSRDRKSVV